MCGRYALTVEPAVLAALFALEEFASFEPRYNLAPSQAAPVVTKPDGAKRVTSMRWGLLPTWAKDPRFAYKTINARSETAASKPAFRSAFKKRRAIVPASWFYEWEKIGKEKVPHRIRRADGAPLSFAGLFEHWPGDAKNTPRLTFTILTTEANEDVAHLHTRMPCILEPDAFDRWLEPNVDDVAATAQLLKPAASGTLVTDRVSTRVNSVKNDGPDLLTPDTLF